MPKFLDTPQWYGSGGQLCKAWESLPPNTTETYFLTANHSTAVSFSTIYCHVLSVPVMGKLNYWVYIVFYMFDTTSTQYGSIEEWPNGDCFAYCQDLSLVSGGPSGSAVILFAAKAANSQMGLIYSSQNGGDDNTYFKELYVSKFSTLKYGVYTFAVLN